VNSTSHRLLALNLGSASLKAASYVDLSNGNWTCEDRPRIEFGSSREEASDHGLQALAEQLPTSAGPDVVVHRIVHGGDRTGAIELDASVVRELEELSSLAPLHQPPALDLLRQARERWPAARHWAAFDSSWHATMPLAHRVLPLPKALFDRGVRRYGFHGLAFQSAMRQLRVRAPDRANGRVVLAHLGGGSSLCAVLHGRSVNTTMGMTPLGGIPMASRSGSLDPGVVLHLQRVLALGPDEIDRLLWRESGLKGLSGESGDMRILLASRSDDANLAVDVYVSAVVQGIAAMAACVGGIDVLVFSGGIGTHAHGIRQRIVGELAWLGLCEGKTGASSDSRLPTPVVVADVDEEW
jgi:acetate kinase